MVRKLILTFGVLALAAAPVMAQDFGVSEKIPAPTSKTEVLSQPVDSMELHDWAGAACDGDCGRPPCQAPAGGGFFFGAGVYFLKPYWERNPAVPVRTNEGGIITTSKVDFDWNCQGCPYVYCGYLGANGFGVRCRYWQFNNSTSVDFTAPANTVQLTDATGFTAGAAGDVVAAQNALKFYVIDIETLKVWQVGNVRLAASGGLRYLDLKQNYDFVNFTNGQGVSSSNEFNGIGPTFSFRADYRFGQTGLRVFADTRLSVLFGDADRNAAGVFPPIGGFALVGGGHDVLPIGEIEVGARYQTRFGRVLPFIEAAGVGQVWWGAGNGSANPLGGNPTDGNMGLAGFRLTAGIAY